MRNSLLTTFIALMGAAMLAIIPSCGGGSHHTAQIPAPGGNEIDGPGLVLLKDASGAPTGVRVYWWRDNAVDTTGYYLYRDTQPITTADPALRVNGGSLIPQPASSVTAIIFDDLFAAQYKTTYYYRATTVDLDGDESALSTERSITIAQFSISSFSPTQGRVGLTVFINGSYFGNYDNATDAVYFSGVQNDKGPSALFSAFVSAQIVAWEDTRITVKVPIGATVGPLRVICNNVPLETTTDFTCISPYILSVNPDPATAGETFDIFGANFGPPEGSNALMVDDVAYQGIFTAWTPTQVTCTLPATLLTGLSKIELRIGTEITNPYYCVIMSSDAPAIEMITPDYGTPGDTVVTISGRNFGTDPTAATVWFHEEPLDSTSFLTFSDTEITLNVPFTASHVGNVYISYPDGYSSNKWIYHTLPNNSMAPNKSVVAGYNMGKYSDMAYSSADEPYVIFTDNTGGAELSRLMLGYISGANWVYEKLAVYGTTPDCIAYPRIKVDDNGVVHFAYQRGIGGNNPTEVRYGQWNGGLLLDELVTTGSAGTHHGDYLALDVVVDSLGGTNAILFWGDNGARLYGSYKLDGDATWTTEQVYNADSAYSQVLGFNCSIDLIEAPAGSPPDNLWAVASSSDESTDTPTRKLLVSTWDVVAGWGTQLTYEGSDNGISETCALWSNYDDNIYVMWCNGGGVYCSYDFLAGGTTDTILSLAAPFGAALGLREEPSTGKRILIGNALQTSYFWAEYDAALGSWSVSQANSPDGRKISKTGRGGAAVSSSMSKGICSVYDPDMRDAIAAEEDKSSGTLTVNWNDIGDHFATPGYNLSNRALAVNNSGTPFAVFADTDPITGAKTLWAACWVSIIGEIGLSSHWEYYLLDSAASGTLGRASVAIDFNNDLHIAYLKGSDVYYTDGNFITGFKSPIFLETVGAIACAPQIGLGIDSTQDVNILVPRQGTDWMLILIRSTDAMSTHEVIQAAGTSSAITQCSLAMLGDGNAAAASFVNIPMTGNRLITWNSRTWMVDRYDGTANMNAGITLSMDDDEKYCVTAADISGTTRNYWLRWNDVTSAYELTTFGMAETYPSTSTMMSQSRNEYGPVIGYTTRFTTSNPATTDLWGNITSSGGADIDVNAFNSFDSKSAPATYHSIEPTSDTWCDFLFYLDDSYFQNLLFRTQTSEP